jgi:hypothetical protein
VCTDDLAVGLAAISEATGVFQIHGTLSKRAPGGAHCLACRRVEKQDLAFQRRGAGAAGQRPDPDCEAIAEAYINADRNPV